MQLTLNLENSCDLFILLFQNKWLSCPLQCPSPTVISVLESEVAVLHSVMEDYQKLKYCEWVYLRLTDEDHEFTIESDMLASSLAFSLVPPLWPQRPLNDLGLVGKCGLGFCFGWHLQQCTSAGLYSFLIPPKGCCILYSVCHQLNCDVFSAHVNISFLYIQQTCSTHLPVSNMD